MLSGLAIQISGGGGTGLNMVGPGVNFTNFAKMCPLVQTTEERREICGIIYGFLGVIRVTSSL